MEHEPIASRKAPPVSAFEQNESPRSYFLNLYPFSSPRGVPFDNESSESRQEDSRGDSLPLFLPPLESEDK